MNIKCGNCQQRHESVGDVRSCYQGSTYARTSVLDAQRSAPINPPRKPVDLSAPAPEYSWVTQDGMYRNPETGEIWKVQFNRATGDGRRLYAKQLELDSAITGDTITRIPLSDDRGGAEQFRAEFVYAPGAIRNIRPKWRMTIEDAKKFGAMYGTCVRCARTLTREESIDRAMGPVCAKASNWAA
jgi:hypothetical protein